MRWTSLSLRQTLIIGAGLGILLPAVALAVLQINAKLKNEVDLRVRAPMLQYADVLSNAMGVTIWNVDQAVAEKLVDAVMRNPDVASVVVTNEYGEIFIQKQNPTNPAATLLRDEREIAHNGARAGHLVLALSTERIERELWIDLIKLAVALISQVALSFAFIWLLFELRLLRPLRALQDSALRLASGELDQAVRWQHQDEIGDLSQSLDTMRKNLSARISERDQKNTDLQNELSERRRAEAALRISQAKFSGIFEASPVAMTVSRMGGDFKLLDVNSAWIHLFNLERDRMIGTSGATNGMWDSQHDRITVLDTLTQLGQIKNYSAWMRHGKAGDDHNKILCAISGRVVALGDEPLLILSYEDTTAKHQYALELAQHQDHLEAQVKERTQDLHLVLNQAEAANRAKSVFLANMSHELRTPLNAILGFAQLLQRDNGLNEEGKKKLATINRAGQHLLALINDVLEISRIEAGRISIQRAPLDLTDLLGSIEEIIRGRAEAKGLVFSVEYAADLPMFVEGDEHRLKQVLINLLGNGVKYTDRGSVTLRVSKNNGEINFEVCDTGAGIAAEDQERIFQPFYQTDVGIAKGEGTGLGLAISLEYTRLMGGRLTVDSQPGRGSVFVLSVSLQQTHAPILKVAAGRVLGLESGQDNIRVLVVDDKADNRELVRQLLEGAGFIVRTADNGRQAIDIFQDWHPQFIWMDMRMPVMDGYDSTRTIRTLTGGDQVKIVALTASAFEEDRAAVLAAGCDDMERKPLEVDRLFGMMGKLLGLRYRYNDEAQAAQPPAGEVAKVDLSILPIALLSELRTAAEQLDLEAARHIVERIGQQFDKTLAITLASLIDGYRFDPIVAMCDAIAERTGHA
ncbi:MAG: ATP-binding protein [Pseudomonadota bacterium]